MSDEIKEFASKPSPESIKLIRQISVLAAVALVGGLVAWLVFDRYEGFGLVMTIGALCAIPRWFASDEAKTAQGYALRYAWCGERVKPARLIDAKYASQLRAQAADEAARDTTPGWVRAGMPSDQAPRPDYDTRWTAVPESVELSAEEMNAVEFVTGTESMAVWVGSVAARTGRDQWVTIEALVARGILRRTAVKPPSKRCAKHAGPGNAELTPAYVPLLGVARFAATGLLAQWQDGGVDRRVECLTVPGRVVQLERLAGVGTRVRLTGKSVDVVIEELVGARAALATPRSDLERNALQISPPGSERSEFWWVTPSGVDGFAVEQFDSDEPPRLYSEAEFREWLRGQLAA